MFARIKRRTLLVAAFLAALLILLFYWLPSPPSKITIATSFKGGAYEFYGQRYRDILARSGIKVELRNTDGSGENLRLLGDPKSGVQVAFVQGGFSNKKESPHIVSLGRIGYQPFWIFYRDAEVWIDLTDLRGKRIAIGPVGGGTRTFAENVLAAIGEAPDSDRFESFFGRPAVTALHDGKVDAVFLPGPIDSPLIQELLRDKAIRLLNIPRADALTHRIPALVSIRIPAGMIDFAQNLPARDFTILGTTTATVAVADLHPGIVRQLAAALEEVHGEEGPFQKAGEFPTQRDPEFAFSEVARDYYRSGPAFLDRYLPFWMTTYAQRLIAVLLAIFAIGLPALNYLTRFYRWITRERTLRLYRALRAIEKELHSELQAARISELQASLDELDHSASLIKIPRRHTDLIFTLKVHVNLVRTRLANRLAEVKSRAPKAA